MAVPAVQCPPPFAVPPLCCVAASIVEPSSVAARVAVAAVAGGAAADQQRLRCHSFALGGRDRDPATRVVGRSRRGPGGFAVTMSMGPATAAAIEEWVLALHEDGFVAAGGTVAVPHAVVGRLLRARPSAAAAAAGAVPAAAPPDAWRSAVADIDGAFAAHRQGSRAFFDLEHLLDHSDCAPPDLAAAVVTGAAMLPGAFPPVLRPVAAQCLALNDNDRATAYAAVGAYLLLDRYAPTAARGALNELLDRAMTTLPRHVTTH